MAGCVSHKSATCGNLRVISAVVLHKAQRNYLYSVFLLVLVGAAQLRLKVQPSGKLE